MRVPATEKNITRSVGHPDASENESGSTDSVAHDDGMASSSSIWRSVRHDVLLLGAGNIGVVVAQLAFRSILLAVLAPAAYGRLSLILSVYSTVWIIGAVGLPNSIARYIATIAPVNDAAIIRSACRAGIWPTMIAAIMVAAGSAVILGSSLAAFFTAIGVSCLVYSLITMGILRGRGRFGAATAIMPIAGFSEVTLLIIVLLSGIGVTPLSALVVFSLGNVIGLIAGCFYVIRTAPPKADSDPGVSTAETDAVPSARELLSFSMWLGAATVGIVALPLILRFAATFDSYATVATIDIALVLLAIPQRIGAVIVAGVIPHAMRALNDKSLNMTLSRREHMIVIVPFIVAAVVVAFSPIIGWLFSSIGRSEYVKSGDYLGLTLLAAPARILYGLVEGVLVAHGDGKFLAFNSLSIAALASVGILATTILGSVTLALVVFVIACWAVYICGLRRIELLNSTLHLPGAT